MAQFRFSFNEERAADAAALIARLDGGCPEFIRVIKLMYLADRESLKTRGTPIIGDRYVSMKHGPVMSDTYNLIKEGADPTRNRDRPWHKRVERRGRYGLCEAPGDELGALSHDDVEIIKRVVRRHRQRNTWALCEWTHSLPEWSDPGSSMRNIRVREYLQHLGWSEDDVERITADERQRQAFDAVLARAARMSD